MGGQAERDPFFHSKLSIQEIDMVLKHGSLYSGLKCEVF